MDLVDYTTFMALGLGIFLALAALVPTVGAGLSDIKDTIQEHTKVQCGLRKATQDQARATKALALITRAIGEGNQVPEDVEL